MGSRFPPFFKGVFITDLEGIFIVILWSSVQFFYAEFTIAVAANTGWAIGTEAQAVGTA
ncbi:hypothetical protein GCM10022277_22150 [Litoribacillus peritrichatus]|uniref:Uncharacterized protein n=1 Tax=Litoribacillus peritrichatus TaxID=718191 RepID=A0ABP7MP32_9GAMM